MKDIGQIIIASLQKVFENFFGIIPNIIGCFVVFLFGYILVQIIGKILKKILNSPSVQASLDKLQDGIGFSKNKLDVATLTHKTITNFLLLIVLLTATDILGLDILSKLLSQLVQYIPKLLSAILMFVFGIYFSGLVKKMVATAAKSMGIKAWQMMGNMVFYFLIIAISVSALGQAGVDTGLITANISIIIAGVMLGFAIAYGHSARNVLSGILTAFYSRNHFKLGQIIEIDSIKGTIIGMDNMTLTLDSEGKTIMLPIHKLLNEKVIIHP